jgi:1-deoxy-D-xylulose-5-phosphate synthase
MDEEFQALPIGKAEVLREGRDLLIIAVGSMVTPALETASELEKEGFSIGVVNCRFVKPLDQTLVESSQKIGKVLVLEENSRSGGLGGAILELLSDMNAHDVRLKRLGLPDKFIEHGPATVLKQKYGLDVSGIVKEARDFCQEP